MAVMSKQGINKYIIRFFCYQRSYGDIFVCDTIFFFFHL